MDILKTEGDLNFRSNLGLMFDIPILGFDNDVESDEEDSPGF